MNILRCTLYAVLLALVLGVGCGGGKEKEEKAAKAAAAAEAKAAAETKAKAAADWKVVEKDLGEVVKWYRKESAKSKAAADWNVIEKAIRSRIFKRRGELTKADFEKVTSLDLGYARLTSVQGLEKLTQLTSLGLQLNNLTELPKGLEKLTQLKVLSLGNNQLTDVKGLEKLTQLKALYLSNNPNLTKAQIAALQKALPNCKFLELR
jgi:Leucine-rich repeat (LRR) protein